MMEEWQNYKEVLDLFCFATHMKISDEKSSFLYNDIDETVDPCCLIKWSFCLLASST